MQLMCTSDEAKKQAKLFNLAVIETTRTVKIETKEDETKAVAYALEKGEVIVECIDWKVIPLENLVAKLKGKAKIKAIVSSVEEATVVLGALELGVDSVILRTEDVNEIEKIANLKNEHIQLELNEAKVVAIKRVGMGVRVCLDSGDLMSQGEGMLVGCASDAFMLVQGEVDKNELADPRPFRVNAGALSLYLFNNRKISYLQEMKAGDDVLIVNRNGNTRKTHLVRSKIEKRPMLLIEAESEGKKVKAVLQDAETIRLVTKNGSISVRELKLGDEILCSFAKAGRHFGTAVNEFIVER